MSFATAHNRPLEVRSLYFEDNNEVMATCVLATNETAHLSLVAISDRRVILRALAQEPLWPVLRTAHALNVLPVLWSSTITIIETIVRGPPGLSAREARVWQDVRSQFLDDFADAIADSTHVGAQADRAMTHFFTTLSLPLDDHTGRRVIGLERYLYQAPTPPLNRLVDITTPSSSPSPPVFEVPFSPELRAIVHASTVQHILNEIDDDIEIIA